MQYPQEIPPGEHVRRLTTSDRDALAEFHVGKGRHYVQLAAGQMRGEVLDARFGDFQVCRERVSAGLLVHAAPANDLVPFGVPLADCDPFQFCGEAVPDGCVLLADGGEWEAHLDAGVDYLLWVFSRASFESGVETLTGRPVMAEWTRSGVYPSDPAVVARHARWLSETLNRVAALPQALDNDALCRAVEAEALRVTVRALTVGDRPAKRVPLVRRRAAVRKAIEYVQAFADQLPSIPQLCAVTGVSERTLEYAFRELCGVTPQRYIKLVRLNAARSMLTDARRTERSVTEVALHWGFLQPGRFAGEYRQMFGELPSVTLKHH